MNIDNTLIYIKSGLGLAPEKKPFQQSAGCPFLLVLTMGLIPGIVLGGYRLFLSIVMFVTSLSMMLSVMKRLECGFTVKNRLIMQVIIYVNFVLQCLLLGTLWFPLIPVVLCALYIPPILIPLLLGIRASRRLRKNIPFNTKAISRSGFRISFSLTGFVGMAFAAVCLKDLSQQALLIIMMICIVLLESVLTIIHSKAILFDEA